MLAAEIFALTVFFCDGLLQLKPVLPNQVAAGGASRFCIVASKLPMELQMILCRRVVGSTKQNIEPTDSDAAFRSLARILSESK